MSDVKYPLHYSTLERDVKKLIEYIELLNDPNYSRSHAETATRAALRTIKIENEISRINTFLDFFPMPAAANR